MVRTDEEYNVECPLCGSEGVLIHKGVRDDKKIDVYECKVCGIKFLSSFKELDYADGAMHKSNHMLSLTPQEHLKKCAQDDERRYQMIQGYCTGKTVLDFGCGYGGVLGRIAHLSNQTYGVELGELERNYMMSVGITCYKTLEEVPEPVDVITLFHVFEHLKDPKQHLLKFSRQLKRGGVLIIEVPNANDILLSLYKCKAFEDFTYWSAHLILWNEKSLVHMIESTGEFEAVEIGYCQRYPIANHLLWLSRGKCGGERSEEWKFLNERKLMEAYVDVLKEQKMCDTIFQVWRKL